MNTHEHNQLEIKVKLANYRTVIQMTMVLLLIFPMIASASQCKKDLAAVDSGIKNQYGTYESWWDYFKCPVCLGGDLRKSAIVNKSQIKEISSMRNIAYMQMSRGDEKLCIDTLRTPKRMLRLS
jgi:hypothetical protein